MLLTVITQLENRSVMKLEKNRDQRFSLNLSGEVTLVRFLEVIVFKAGFVNIANGYGLPNDKIMGGLRSTR